MKIIQEVNEIVKSASSNVHLTTIMHHRSNMYTKITKTPISTNCFLALRKEPNSVQHSVAEPSATTLTPSPLGNKVTQTPQAPSKTKKAQSDMSFLRKQVHGNTEQKYQIKRKGKV